VLEARRHGSRRCAAHPELGKEGAEIRSTCRSRPIRKHVACFTFDERSVLIQRVLHASMDPDLHLEDET